MQSLASRVSLSVVSVVVVGVVAAPAAAARPPITGKLSEPGYTVVALAANGKARVVRATTGSFRLRPPARSVTLQLRGPDGVYAGPVVVRRAKRGKVAILGLRPGARLGRVRVRRGYAHATSRPARRSVDSDVRVRARRGVPIGAGNFGRVFSRHVRSRIAGDRDIDGIPDLLDVDDDGDRVLDRLERPARGARAAQEPDMFTFHSRLTLYLDRTANANATGMTPAQMDAALAYGGDLLLQIMPGDDDPDSPELDCGGAIQDPPRPDGLIYCRPHASGGIGRMFQMGVSDQPPFPDCCDLDMDGLGTLRDNTTPPGQPSGNDFTLRHQANTSQIGTGDVMIQRVLRGGVETAWLASLPYLFASVPALVSYDDGRGPVTVPYPVTDPNAPGTRGNGFPVEARANGDVVVTLKFWRPQRKPEPAWGESGDWIDIGHLRYEVQFQETGNECPQTTFSEDDPDLALHSSSPVYAEFPPGFSDTDGDHPSSTSNTFTYTLNLTDCLRSDGAAFGVGDERVFSFVAADPAGVDNAQQGIWFRRVP